MQLCRVQLSTGDIRPAALAEGRVRLLNVPTLADVLHGDDPAAAARAALDPTAAPLPVQDVTLLAPLDRQEVWAAGVTYKRSREAREAESAGAGRFYDLVYA